MTTVMNLQDLETTIQVIDIGFPHSDATAIHTDVSNEFNITEKTIININDKLLIEDSEATNAKKMIKISNLLNGYTGSVILDGKTLTITNGLITDIQE